MQFFGPQLSDDGWFFVRIISAPKGRRKKRIGEAMFKYNLNVIDKTISVTSGSGEPV